MRRSKAAVSPFQEERLLMVVTTKSEVGVQRSSRRFNAIFCEEVRTQKVFFPERVTSPAYLKTLALTY
jgi:hypothetical protein